MKLNDTMKSKKVIMLIAVLALCVLLGLLTGHPLIFCDLELPESYTGVIRNQTKGLYSQSLPLVPVCAIAESFVDETVCYTIYYFPFGTVGMSYHPTDGYNIEKPLSRM